MSFKKNVIFAILGYISSIKNGKGSKYTCMRKLFYFNITSSCNHVSYSKELARHITPKKRFYTFHFLYKLKKLDIMS